VCGLQIKLNAVSAQTQNKKNKLSRKREWEWVSNNAALLLAVQAIVSVESEIIARDTD
jgi:hypothetical protein